MVGTAGCLRCRGGGADDGRGHGIIDWQRGGLGGRQSLRGGGGDGQAGKGQAHRKPKIEGLGHLLGGTLGTGGG